MVDAKTQALGHLGVAITFGLVIMVMIYAVGHVSGAYRRRRSDAAFRFGCAVVVWATILTVFLMFVIVAVATDTRAVGEAAAIAIGGTVGLDALFGGPISGASMNPARSLGPALVSGDSRSLWIYLTAPLLGAAIGAIAYQIIRGDDPIPTESQAHEGAA